MTIFPLGKFALKRREFVLGSLSLAACSPGDNAETNFYAGKTVNIVVGYGAGGGYDAFARLIGVHLAKHIPGQPTVIVQNRPGAGSLTAANYVAKVGPQDGLYVAATGSLPLLSPLLQPEAVQFNPRELNWMPSSGGGIAVVIAWGKLTINSWEDLKTRGMSVGGSSSDSQATFFGRVVNATLGTKIRFIFGYSEGSASELLAMERGEIEGHSGLMWVSLKTIRPEWVRDGTVKVLLQYGNGGKPASDLPNVPYVRDLLQNDADREAYDIAMAPLEILRPYFMGPGVPPERVAIMSQAFLDTYNDPAFRTDAMKMQVELDPASAAEVKALVDRMYSAPPPIVERLRAIFAGKA